jgi:hypothetical protein
MRPPPLPVRVGSGVAVGEGSAVGGRGVAVGGNEVAVTVGGRGVKVGGMGVALADGSSAVVAGSLLPHPATRARIRIIAAIDS